MANDFRSPASSADLTFDELFQLLVDNVKDYAIFILNPGGSTITWNAGVERLLGYTETEFIGLPFYRLFKPTEQQAAAREMQSAAANGRSDDERWHLRRDGAEIWVTGVLTALRNPQGELRGYAKIMRDTTLQKSAASEREELLERELAARADAEQANRIKDEFLAIVSHELRTPLNAILGWARMLATDQLDATSARRAVEVIERNARAQAQLIDDLLDVSRIITGKFQIDIRPLVLRQLVEASVESVAHSAKEKGVRLTVEPSMEAGVIEGDAARLQQVVLNVLSNAIKFTPAGGEVVVGLHKTDHSVDLTIRDTGEGIDTQDLPLIFDRFHQAARVGAPRPQGGLGLGLAIARHIVEAHGGTVRAESPGKGEGTTVTMHLPMASSVAPTQELPHADLDLASASPLGGRSVLVVEDRLDSRELLEVLFEECHMKVVSVESTRAALKALDANHFDVIVSDIGLSEAQDGLALMRMVRSRGAKRGGRTPAVALTAYASSKDRAEALAAGYQVHLSKPFEPSDLIATITNLLSGADRPAS